MGEGCTLGGLYCQYFCRRPCLPMRFPASPSTYDQFNLLCVLVLHSTHVHVDLPNRNTSWEASILILRIAHKPHNDAFLGKRHAWHTVLSASSPARAMPLCASEQPRPSWLVANPVLGFDKCIYVDSFS